MKLEMLGVSKSFGSNRALDQVNFHLEGGEICALLGENGAGKTTLMNILGGVVRADQGEILIDGEEQNFPDPQASLSKGIAFIHQELSLINDLCIYENIFLGRELHLPSRFLDRRRMIDETRRLLGAMDIDLDPCEMVGELDPSYKQIIEIVRAIHMKAGIIIMDEPTSSLQDHEVERVFAMMKKLSEQKVGIIFISHKLREVFEICSRCVVLRNGRLVSDGDLNNTTPREIAKAMVGHEVRTERLRVSEVSGEEVFRAENLNDADGIFRSINLTACRGEIVGISGLLGDGRTELFQSIFGARSMAKGRLWMEGREVKINSTTQALACGLGYVPGNRKENGIFADLSILENGSIITLEELSRWGHINRKEQIGRFNALRKQLGIRMGSEKNLITSLSGGNQQKVVLAKWLDVKPKILVLDNPTQGVDVGAKEDIYDIILGLADSGMTIFILANEAQEIIRLCDRVLVMFHGAIQGELAGQEMTEQEIMHLATGGEKQND